MRNFKNKKEVFGYIVRLFKKKSKLILIRGSTAKSKLKIFSDIDAEVHGKNKRKPYYEIIFVNKMPVLISAYFYKYKEGKKEKAPSNLLILHGNYNNNIRPDFSKDNYNNKEKVKRECQIVIDFMFKYLRSKNKIYLEFVQRRIK